MLNTGQLTIVCFHTCLIVVLPQGACADVLRMPGALMSMEFVPVGHAGNPPDPSGTLHLGSVAEAFEIGKYEVTVAQYAEFLNATGASDPHGLYNDSGSPNMTAFISRTGSSGSYVYTVIAGKENLPISYVSWFDAARMANWLHNGQGTGSTEYGAYQLQVEGGVTTIIGNRTTAARYFLPTENEWYKAAYFNPADGDVSADKYWFYPTKSDSAPSGTAPGGANYQGAGHGTSQELWQVGTCFEAPNYFGTFDQAGNVWEWNETVIAPGKRGLRGGGVDNNEIALQSTWRAMDNTQPTFEGGNVGFRLARARTNLSCPADLNNDNFVDDQDFVLFSEAYNELICP